MKQSVAPESTSAFVSAIALLVLIETGTCIDRNRVVTITELNLWTALTQADGFRRSENPLSLRGPSLPVLVRLLLLLLPPAAMNQLVAVGFEWLIVPQLVVRRRLRMCFCHPRLLLVLGLDVESNYAAFHCYFLVVPPPPRPLCIYPPLGTYPPRGIVAGFISSLPVTRPRVLPADVSMAFGSVSIL